MDDIKELVVKKEFSIQDLSRLLMKKTQTIRKWENKGVISKCNTYGDNGWRVYSKKEFAGVLQEVIDYNWEREVIYNKTKIKYVIKLLNEGENND